jgi:SAM-dependent methyltransferase
MNNHTVPDAFGSASALPWAGARFYGPPYVDTAEMLYGEIRAAIKPADVVLDAGAGPWIARPIKRLRGLAAKVCGIDVDEAVLRNTALDEARVVRKGEPWPYPDATFDLVFSDYVLEHLETPAEYLAEVRRVLKPGCPFYFRTVNAWHPVSGCWRVLPFSLQSWLVRKVQARLDGAHDPYPTYLRANSRGRLRRLLRESGFAAVDVRTREEPPTYLAGLGRLSLIGVAWERLANRFGIFAPLRVTLYGEAR